MLCSKLSTVLAFNSSCNQDKQSIGAIPNSQGLSIPNKQGDVSVMPGKYQIAPVMVTHSLTHLLKAIVFTCKR